MPPDLIDHLHLWRQAHKVKRSFHCSHQMLDGGFQSSSPCQSPVHDRNHERNGTLHESSPDLLLSHCLNLRDSSLCLLHHLLFLHFPVQSIPSCCLSCFVSCRSDRIDRPRLSKIDLHRGHFPLSPEVRIRLQYFRMILLFQM